MADITEVMVALREGKGARREGWSPQSRIYLNENRIIVRRIVSPYLGPQEIPLEIDWNDLTASDWILIDFATHNRRRSDKLIH
jgi:hypothetical protein